MSHADENRVAAKGRLGALKLSERARRAQLPMRLAMAAIGCGFIATEIGIQIGLIAFLVIAASQCIDTSVKSLLVRPERQEELSTGESLVIDVTNVQAALIYGLVPIISWFLPDPGYKIFAGFWLSGSMLHVMLHMHHETRSFLSAFIPHALVTLSLPVASLVVHADVSLSTTGALIFATSVFVAHFAGAFRTYRQKSEDLRLATLRAEEQQQAAEAASHAKSQFLATLSHEIRTPLNGIIGMVRSLGENDLPKEAKEQIQVLRQSSDLLVVLLNDVLDVSKIEAGQLEVEAEPFALPQTVRDVLALHAATAVKKGLRLEADIEEGLHAHREGDRHRLFQVLHNLVGNAIKFTRFGAVRVRVYSEGEGRVVISVQDTGIGMSDDQLAKVFQPFMQADSSTTRRFGGTGLGLTISQGLVEAMGGEMIVTSEERVGSTFSIRLSLPELEGEAVSPEAKRETTESPLKGQRILAVDDNEVNLKVLEAVLKNEDCQLVTAISGEQALGLFSPDAFDLILLDISMPGLDGPATLHRMRSIAAERPMPPALAVTAHAMPEDVARFLSMGFSGFVAKPLRRSELLTAIGDAGSSSFNGPEEKASA